jgi:hypothetical protein
MMARILVRIAITSAAGVWLFRIIGETAERRRSDIEKRAVREALIAGRKSPPTSPSNQAYFDALRARVKSARNVHGKQNIATPRARRKVKPRSIVELAGSLKSPVRGVSIADMNPWQGPSLAWLFHLAHDVWDDASDAWAWMSTPHLELGGRTPIEAATTSAGAERVEDILRRIIHGTPP